MMDLDTFLITVYVTVEDRCVLPADPPQPGPAPSRSRSELLTLAMVGQWSQFPSERAFYRYVQHHWRRAVPTLPGLNRLLRHWHPSLVAVGLQVAQWLDAATGAYEILDGMGVATRNAKRRGPGWLDGQADIGVCTRLGGYEGVHLLTAVTPQGAITGYGLAPASTKDQPLAESFLAVRATQPAVLPQVGQPALSGRYVADKGYRGAERQRRWRTCWGAAVICPPQKNDRRRWPRALRRQFAALRQVVETVHDHLLSPFRLEHERPHGLDGLVARLAAKVALHNLCLWLNQQGGRPLLALADLIDW